MSRAYRIRVSENVTRVIHVEDGLGFHLEVLDVLPRERMGELTRKELAARGYEPREGVLVKRYDEVEVVVDHATGAVTVRVDAEGVVEEPLERERRVANPTEGLAKLQADVSQEAERLVERKRTELRQAITPVLERQLPAIRDELDRIGTRVTARALEERARQMREIEEICEDEETGDLVIRVRVRASATQSASCRSCYPPSRRSPRPTPQS